MNQNTQQSPSSLLSTRNPDRLKNLTTDKNGEVLILKAPSDWGTVLNNGRRGSLFAPNVLENLLLKTAAHKKNNHFFEIHEVTNRKLEEPKNLKDSQELQAKKIIDIISQNAKFKFLLHLGGGHDHFFPLMMAKIQMQSDQKKKILILNIDPHLDTRTDSWANSGTPFRNIDQILTEKNITHVEITLAQLGTQLFANGESNFEPLKKINQKIFDMIKIRHKPSLVEFMKTEFENHLNSHLNSYDEVILSFDVDAIKASEMPAVSAPNHQGFRMDEMHELVEFLKNSLKEKFNTVGIYEYNPMFDDHANSSGRELTAFIYQHFILKDALLSV